MTELKGISIITNLSLFALPALGADIILRGMNLKCDAKLIRGVLFDFDGTLTEPGSLDFGVIGKAIGCPRGRPVLEFIREMESAEGRAEASRILDEFEAEAARGSHPNHGAEEVLEYLRSRQIQFGIISRNSLASILTALENFQKIRHSDFGVILSRDDPYSPKPNPEGILAAAQTLGIPVSQILVVGDFVFDVVAGHQAGALTAFLTNRGTHSCAYPSDFTLENLEDLVAIVHAHASPPAGKSLCEPLLRHFHTADSEKTSLSMAPGVAKDFAARQHAGKEALVIGVDLGGTKVEACLMDSKQNILSRHRTYSEPALGLDRVVDNICEVINKAAGGKRYQALGMGTPGTYVPGFDKLFGVPHTPVYEVPGFMKRVRSRLDVPLVIENDANCLALAEYFASCVDRYRFVLAVIIGTGMGYGLILDGKLYRGAGGGAGEIGHTTINYQGRICECGRKGCAEAYLSGSSISRRFQEATGETLDVEAIYRRYQASDPAAQLLFEESCQMMGEVLANAVNAFDLQAIILGGGVSNLPIWYEKVPAFLSRSLFGPPRGTVPILKAALGDSAGVVGAAFLALRHLDLMTF